MTLLDINTSFFLLNLPHKIYLQHSLLQMKGVVDHFLSSSEVEQSRIILTADNFDDFQVKEHLGLIQQNDGDVCEVGSQCFN